MGKALTFEELKHYKFVYSTHLKGTIMIVIAVSEDIIVCQGLHGMFTLPFNCGEFYPPGGIK